MPSKGGLIYHLTCLLYAPYLDPKNPEFSLKLPISIMVSIAVLTRRPASADRTARCQFQTVFPVITSSSFPTNIIVHLHGLSMALTVGRTVSLTVDSTIH